MWKKAWDLSYKDDYLSLRDTMSGRGTPPQKRVGLLVGSMHVYSLGGVHYYYYPPICPHRHLRKLEGTRDIQTLELAEKGCRLFVLDFH